MRAGLMCLLMCLLLLLLLAIDAGSVHGRQATKIKTKAKKVAVVNLAGPSAAATARELRAYLIGRGVGQTPQRELRELLERGDLPAPYEGPKLDRARAAYAAFDYARAQQLLESEASRALKHARSGKALLEAVREIFVWRAVVAVAQKDADSAVRWFRAVLRLAPNYALDAARFNPRVQQAFNTARRPIQQKLGTLVIGDADKARRLQINGAPGRARGELPPGPHLVVARNPGYLPSAFLVEVHAEKQTTVPLKMVRETPVDRGRRALFAASAVAEEKRIEALLPLAEIVKTTRLLVITTKSRGGGGESARLYDLKNHSASKPVDLQNDTRLGRVAALTGLITRKSGAPRRRPVKQVSLYRRWWFWTAVGVVAAGAGVITFVATRDAENPTLVCCQ